MNYNPQSQAVNTHYFFNPKRFHPPFLPVSLWSSALFKCLVFAVFGFLIFPLNLTLAKINTVELLKLRKANATIIHIYVKNCKVRKFLPVSDM
jgi:hypothetical protein